ncbi:hypothetical protein ES319_D05G081800v1 [Gossypium barbadense]|uniref:F-box domain-containing protein n=2 Tax=Gossypium TaxID=3633 RepID=A0A5J5RDC4_GOSBA|nr:hypothetical protein ES319_D05G081800v1 [Gossypium barbadense]TYG67568.1 hypothetical protein ES288_D05G086300v1 [Gossypium darwinii]
MASPPPSSSIAKGGDGIITTLHPDIIRALILTRLDGPDLASTACVSSYLRSLSTEENLWRDICCSTWPSLDHPRLKQVISTFPYGHRSFFSESFPFPNPQPPKPNVRGSLALATELISAVDIYYHGNPIYSKVVEMETSSSWFLSTPFRLNLLGVDNPAPRSPIKYGSSNDDTWLKHLEENLSSSWIIVDPTREKAVNMSSKRAVSVERHWLTGDVQVRYGRVMEGDEGWGSSRELVACGVVVTCGEKGGEGEKMHVREVCMRMEDMDGKGLSGEESLVILERAMGSGRSWKGKGKGEKEKYEEFMAKKRERKERNLKKDRVWDLICIFSIFAACGAFWWFVLPILPSLLMKFV